MGTCDLCGVDNVSVYDTDTDDYLVELFEGLFDIYVEEDEFEGVWRQEKMKFLKDELKENWDIFEDSITPFMIETIVKNICKEYFDIRKTLLTKNIGILKLADVEYLDENSIVGRYNWDIFVESIREKYRFHTDIFVKKILKKYCQYLVRVIKKGDVFYRARISNERGYSNDEMGSPPKELVRAGRINPEGLSYLYLADSPETTVYETRASLHDFVCIGKFKALQDIRVIDLTGLDKISVFFTGLDYDFHAINRGHLKRINEEVAKSVRSGDTPLEYLPTQYICDYIKSIPSNYFSDEQAYQGIMYKSTMIKESYNIAVFMPELFTCISTEVKSITKVNYEY
jgi:hypothetical protein